MQQLFRGHMRHLVVQDAALVTLATRTWRARGGFAYPLRVCTVSHAATTVVRLVDITDTVRTIGAWDITEYADVPDVLRQVGRVDRHFSWLVFHERIAESECFWESVEPDTLRPSRMFSRTWREPYTVI